MKRSQVREWAKRGGLIGLLAAGVYVVFRSVVSEPRVLWRVSAGLAVALTIIWFVIPRPKVSSSHYAPFIWSDERPNSAAFDIVDLGSPGEGAVASSISETGEVGGAVILGKREFHAVMWQGGKMRDLGTLGGKWSASTGVGTRGMAVGQSEGKSIAVQGFRWTGSKMEPLPSLDNRLCAAMGVNSQGVIAGASTNKQDQVEACIWKGNRAVSLGVPSGYQFSLAEAVDEAGMAAGLAITKRQDKVSAFVWQDGCARQLDGLGGAVSFAVSTAQGGLVAGGSTLRGEEENPHACLWRDGKARDLDVLPGMLWSVANSVNRSGDVVGASGDGCAVSFACGWHNGKIVDLNSLLPVNSGWALINATGINDRSQVVGVGIYGDRLHAFLLTSRRKSEGLGAQPSTFIMTGWPNRAAIQKTMLGQPSILCPRHSRLSQFGLHATVAGVCSLEHPEVPDEDTE